MKDSLAFRFDRYLKLLRNEIKFNHRGVLIITAGIFFALLLLSYAVSERVGHDDDFMNIWYGITLILGGFAYTSVSFRELNQPQTTHLYLMTPASTLEKFLAKWTLTTIGFIAAHYLIFNLYALMAQGLDGYLGNTYFKPFEPLGWFPLLMMKIYFAVSSIRLLGAVTFRKYAYFKTDLAGFAVSFGLLFVTVLLFRIVFHSYFDGWVFSPQMDNIVMEPDASTEDFIKGPLFTIGKLIVWVGLPLLFWTVGFFKLKETEA